MSPIDQTPIAVRRVVHRPNALAKVLAPNTTPAQDDEEEELLPLDQMLAKRQKEVNAKKFAEQKAAAAARAANEARSRRATTVLSDSDSDLEIQGAPAPVRSRAFGTPGLDRASTPRTLSKSERKIRDLNGPSSTYHHQQEDDPSESQLAEAGHTFGKDLMANHQVAAPRRRSKKGPKPQGAPTIDNDSLNRLLLHRSKQQSLDTVIKKRSAFVRRTNEAAENERLGVGAQVAKVDVQAMMAKKANAMKEAAEKAETDEDEGDGDYEEGAEAEDLDAAMASGSEAERPASSSQPAMVEGEAAEGASAEPRAMEEDEDEEMPAPPIRSKKVRLQADSDAEEEQSAPATVAPIAPVPAPAIASETPFDVQQEGGRRIAFPGMEDEGGFSQFFDSQFSQDVGNVNSVGSCCPSSRSLSADARLISQAEGFHRNENESAAPAPTLLGHVFLNDAERAEDVELLENRGNFRDEEPNTPREAPAPRQYINKQG